ncbi:MAG: response regulator transcription factor [Candidatus Gastranaerophilaceae bacterium]
MVKLTEREQEILNFLTQGYDNKEIGKEINISKHTVKAHVSTIIRKFNAKNRTNVVYIAALNKIINFNQTETHN